MAAIGRWDYASDTGDGTVTVPAKARLMSMSAKAPSDTPATVTINGGDPITIDAGSSWGDQIPPYALAPGDNETLIGEFPIVFTGTSSYYVSWLKNAAR